MKIIIENINKHKECIKTVAEWCNSEWGTNKGYDFWYDWISNSQQDDTLFQTFVIIRDGVLIGTYGIMPVDLSSRQDLSPWIGNLYIDKPFRKNSLSIFKEIVHHCDETCRKLNLKKVYVYTPHKPIVFKRYGFEYIKPAKLDNGNNVSLLFKTYN